MSSSLARTVHLGLVALLLLPALPAEAWVQTVTQNSKAPLRWMYVNRVNIRINADGYKGISDGSDLAAVKASLTAWNEGVTDCSYIQFKLISPDSSSVQAGYDPEPGASNNNAIVWVNQNWPYSRMAVGQTTLRHVDKASHSQDGRIVDADIELNGVDYRFSVGAKVGQMDIENTVTHELGHVLGVDHPCDDGETAEPPKDQNGKAVPACGSSAVPAWMRQTTMWYSAEPGEIKKRTLESDDIAAVCGIYPVGGDPTLESGCAVAAGPADGAGPPPLAALWLLLGLLLLAARRRS